MISFDKIVNKLLKKGGKVIFKEDIFDLIDPDKGKKFHSYLNKTIYLLKSKKIIIPIRNGIYIIPKKEDLNLNNVDLVEKYFFSLAKKIITQNVGSEYYICQKKALEFHLKDYSIPEKLVLMNRKISKKILIGNYQIIFKTITKKDSNIFSKFFKLTKIININGVNFRISNLELALVETTIISDINEGIQLDYITKTIKKYSKVFLMKNFYYIGEYKYIIAFNRLKELSRNIDKNLYKEFLNIIKINGGLFIGEGLRKVI